MSDTCPSGQQLEILWRDERATVVEVGGGIREYFVGDRPVLDPYPSEAMCDGAHGAPLIPWPNRLADGRYEFGGHAYQLALSEPATRTSSTKLRSPSRRSTTPSTDSCAGGPGRSSARRRPG